MTNIGSYEDRTGKFSWDFAAKELGYQDGQPVNIGWYCSDRICLIGKADKPALIYEGFGGNKRKFTFNDVRRLSDSVAVILRNAGIKGEERVCLFMDRIPEVYFSFLGILKIGAIVQPLFSAFGEESLLVRLENAQTRAVITQKKHLSKVRKIKSKLPELKYVFIVDANPSDLQEGEYLMKPEASADQSHADFPPTYAETPSVLHYTSGTTGQPKGVKHVHKSLLAQYLTTKWVLDLQEDDIYWCTADPGWVTGTSYGIIGPWSMGVTQCVFDSGFSAAAWYDFISRNKVTVWYTAPTAIRSLMKAGTEIIGNYDFSSLRHMASVGEPLNAEAVTWGQRNFGKPFYDTYWQTETGSMMICNYPGMKVKPGSMGKPFPGIKGAVLDPKSFEPLNEPGKPGLIAFRPDWPSIMRTYWNSQEAFAKKFVNGWYITGDKAYTDNEGYFWFVGRDDDVINTGGHLVSPFEVESALLEHPSVAESAVVSTPDEINMEVVKAFIALKPGFQADKSLELDIMNFIRKRLSSFAMPQKIEFVAGVPKTRSGKIMRRLLHAREWGEDEGDTSTLEND
jgi:acetyl-CoA synthetase